ncbi:unnamed protein product [Boreogadus saida]
MGRRSQCGKTNCGLPALIRERSILNYLATGKTLVPAGPCSLPGCSPHLLYVEKHLRTHSELPKENVDREIKALKRTTAINQLVALRATDPHPPMVSTLDQTEDQAQQSDPEARVSMCTKRTCVNARLRVCELERELADLRTRLVQLQAKRQPRLGLTGVVIPPKREEQGLNAEEYNVWDFHGYPATLRAAGLAPTTIVLCVGQAISFMEYFRDTPAKYSRSLVKQCKQLRLMAKEDLAKEKIPSLLCE